MKPAGNIIPRTKMLINPQTPKTAKSFKFPGFDAMIRYDKNRKVEQRKEIEIITLLKILNEVIFFVTILYKIHPKDNINGNEPNANKKEL